MAAVIFSCTFSGDPHTAAAILAAQESAQKYRKKGAS